jgi:hypothetical protein
MQQIVIQCKYKYSIIRSCNIVKLFLVGHHLIYFPLYVSRTSRQVERTIDIASNHSGLTMFGPSKDPKAN